MVDVALYERIWKPGERFEDLARVDASGLPLRGPKIPFPMGMRLPAFAPRCEGRSYGVVNPPSLRDEMGRSYGVVNPPSLAD